MNLKWSKIVTHTFLFIGLASVMSACGSKGSSTAAVPQGAPTQSGDIVFQGSHSGGYSDYDLSSYRMVVRNAGALRKMKENPDDNPDYYSVDGALMKNRQVLRALRSGELIGETFCMARYRRSPIRGQVFKIRSAIGGSEDGSQFVYSASIGSRQFSLVCLKAGSPVTFYDIQQSVRDIIDFHSVGAYQDLSGSAPGIVPAQ